MPNKRNPVPIVIVMAVLMLAFVVGGLWLLVDHYLGSSVDKAHDAYEAQQELFEGEDWKRPSDPEAGYQDGDAADDYRQAYQTCTPLLAPSQRVSDELVAASTALQPPELRGRGVELKPVARTDISPTCASAGVTNAQDLASAQLSDETCQILRTCDAALDLIVAGTHRENATSPLHLYDDWTMDDGGSRSPWPFWHLTRLLLIRGHLQALRTQTPEPRLQASLIAIQFGRDLGRGGSLVAVVLGAAIEAEAADILVAGLDAQLLSLTQLQTLLEDLKRILRQPIDRTAAIRAEYLTTAAGLLALIHVDIDAPPAAMGPAGKLQGLEEAAIEDAVSVHAEFWEEVLSVQPRPLQERLDRYTELAGDLDEEFNPLAGVLFADVGKHDINLTATETRLRLITLQVAGLMLIEAGAGRDAITIDLLTTAVWENANRWVDPMTQRSFRISRDKNSISSRALDHDGLARTLDDRQKQRLQVRF